VQQIAQIWAIILENFSHVWPLLLISIPLAVILRVSGLASRMKGAFSARPIVGILIATAAGAFGPFCSCTVIPVVASMLIGGIPLAPVMAFWIASPTMDPEIFFMSIAFLGWNLAIARLVATLLVSLSAGFFTLWLTRRGWIGDDFLRRGAINSTNSVSFFPRLRRAFASLWTRVQSVLPSSRGCPSTPGDGPAVVGCGCTTQASTHEHHVHGSPCCPEEGIGSVASPASEAATSSWRQQTQRILKESVSATIWVGQFLVLAFFLEALIRLYVPQELIVQWIGSSNPLAPALAAIVGVPLYTGNLMALPLIGGLLEHGMDPGAALAFLIAGPVTTICAMTAVWGVVKRRIFVLYIGIGLVGALILGYGYSFLSALFGS
jgi:uncharacterized protein